MLYFIPFYRLKGMFTQAIIELFTEQILRPCHVFTLKNETHKAYPYKLESASMRKFDSSLIYVALFANSELGLSACEV